MGFSCPKSGRADAASCVGRAANKTPARGIRPPSVCGFEPPDFPPAACCTARVPRQGQEYRPCPASPTTHPRTKGW
ncbi:hypothetical protein FE772_09510 [Lysobacter enzymogenes]|nr:hypothetical protein FE772_09510 [Lysobacter enzymogenes]